MKVRHAGLLADKGYRRADSMDEEDIDDPLALSLPALSPSDHYANSYHTEQSNTWRQNSQNQSEDQTEFISDHQLGSINIKNERQTIHYCSSQNIPRSIVMIDKELSGSYISSSISDSNLQDDTHEDAHTRGQLLQEISRVIDDFEPYTSASTPSRSSRSSNVAISNAQHTTDCNYVSSNGTSNWVWSTPNYNRVANPSVNSFYTGTNQSAGVGSIYEYNHATDENNLPVHMSSLNSTSHSLPSVTTPSRDPADSYIVPTSALDLSPSQSTSLSSGASTYKTHNVSQFRGCTVNCNASSGPPAAHLQPSLLQHLDLPSHQLEDGAALDMVINETSHNHQDKVNSGSRHKLVPSESSHTPGTLIEKVNCASVKIETKDISYINGTNGVGTNRNGPDSHEIHENTLLTEPNHNIHQMEDAFRCGECEALFSNMSHLESHLKIHELKPLHLSLKDQGSHENVQEQQKIKKDKYQYKCDKCDMSYTTKLLLLRHKKIHTSKKVYSCNECPSVLTEAGSLVIHKRLHSGDKPFKCNICQQAFSGAGLLATHTRKHTGEKPYTCTNCGMSFRLLSTLKSHMRRHTGEKPFSCDLCHTSFTQRAALKRHQRTHSDFKPWKCQQCGLKFKEKENLRKHMILHKLKSHHTCGVCGKGFTHANKLEKHKISHIGGDRPYKCPKCDSRFTTAKYLTQHQKRVHERKGSMSCEKCHATFNRKETYAAHMKIHEGDKSFVCGECGAAFSRRGTLIKHLRVHYGENNSTELQCKQCGLKYADKNSLEKHLITHSNEKLSDRIDIFYCDSCPNTYSCQEELGLHSRLCHSSYKSNENPIDDSDNVDECKELSNRKYTCEECHQTFFRKHQLKAHHRYCLYTIPSLKSPITPPVPQTQPPTVEGRSTGNGSMYNPILSDNRDVDPIKLLTAVLSLTGTCDLSSPPHTISSSQYNENNTVNTSSFSSMSQSSTQHYHGQNSQEYQYNSHDCSYQHDGIIQNNNHINKPQDVHRSKVLQMPDIPEHSLISHHDNTSNNHTSQYGNTSHEHNLQHSHSECGHTSQHGLVSHAHTLQNGHIEDQYHVRHF